MPLTIYIVISVRTAKEALPYSAENECDVHVKV